MPQPIRPRWLRFWLSLLLLSTYSGRIFRLNPWSRHWMSFPQTSFPQKSSRGCIGEMRSGFSRVSNREKRG